MSAVSPAGASALRPDAPLSIAYLTYRGKPHVGGQGVYTRHLTKALVDLGHSVEVFAGQPYPILDERIELHQAAEPRPVERPLPRPVPRLLGVEEQGRLGRVVQPPPRHVRRAAGVQHAGAQGAEAAHARLRPRARQPVPRLQHPRHREAAAHHRHAPSSDHPATGRWRWRTRRTGGAATRSDVGTTS